MKTAPTLPLLLLLLTHTLPALNIGGIDSDWSKERILRHSSLQGTRLSRSLSENGWNNPLLKVSGINLPVVGNCLLRVSFSGDRTTALEFYGLFMHPIGTTAQEHQSALKKQIADINSLKLYLRNRFGKEQSSRCVSTAETDTYHVWHTRGHAYERVILQINQNTAMALYLVSLRIESPFHERMASSAAARGSHDHHMAAFPAHGVLFLSASSWIPPMYGYHFSPVAAADDNPATSWQVSAAQWKNSWLEMKRYHRHRSGSRVRYRLSLINGFASRHRTFGDLYTGNSRLKQIRILWGDRLQSSRIVHLQDNVRTLQEAATIPCTMTEKPLRVRIQILSVYPGNKWQDIALSEIRLEQL